MSVRKMSRARKTVFTIATLLLAWLVCEGLTFAGLSLLLDNFSLSRFDQQRARIARGEASEGAAEVIHPYLGWCMDPRVASPITHDGHEIEANELGFMDNRETVVRRSDNHFIVGIAGGSVAWQVSVSGEETLKKTLEASPLLKGRRVRIVRLAMSGFKQPQQVMSLAYVLSLGGQFDAVVNIDGYNETALAVGENAMAGVAVSYPRSWQARTIAVTDPRESAETAELIGLRGQRQSMARSLRGSVWRYSPIANLVWRLRDNNCRSRLTELARRLIRSGRSQADRSFGSYGPQSPYTDPEEVAESVIDLWKRSSILMRDMCVGHGADYVHILQANQYHEGSKPMSAQEKMDSIAPNQRAGKAARQLYPKLVEAGPELIAAGVRFSDQTMIFSSIEEPIYVDGWCHYNTRGNTMIAEVAAQQILESLAERN